MSGASKDLLFVLTPVIDNLKLFVFSTGLCVACVQKSAISPLLHAKTSERRLDFELFEVLFFLVTYW